MYTHTYCALAYACVLTWPYKLQACFDVGMHMYTHIIDMYMYVLTCIYTHMYTYTHMYMCTCICMALQTTGVL